MIRASLPEVAARPQGIWAIAFSRIIRETRWEAMARAALRDDVYAEQAGLTAEVLRAGLGAERWLAENASAVERSL